MLKLLVFAPTDLGKRGEISKHSPAFDRITGDMADLRVYSSNNGSKRYLRVWIGEAEKAAQTGLEHGMLYTVGKPMWFELVPATTK